MIIAITLLIITIISLLTLLPAFNIALFGDDWLAIFRYIQHVKPPSKEGWNFLTYFVTPYGSQDLIMGWLYQYFGAQAFYYQLTAYILRMIAAFSLFPLIFYLTKSKIATFFAVLFFAITTIGFDSTGWVLTMPTYLSIAFFNLFLFFYLIFHEKKKIQFLLLSGLFFYLAYVTASARMIGSSLFILSLEFYWLMREKTFKNLKYSLIKIGFMLLIFLIIANTGHSLGNSSDWFDRLNSGINTMERLFQEGRSDFFLYPIITIGGMFIPNFYLPNIQINTKTDMLLFVIIPSLTLFFFLMIIIQANTKRVKSNNLYKMMLLATVWEAIVFLIHKVNLTSLSDSNLILMLITGGLAILIWILLGFRYYSQKNILDALFISFAWSLFAFFLPWVWSPSSYIDTTHRYLTTSAIGISLFMATIISVGIRVKNKMILASTLSLFILLHIFSTRIYINKLLSSHNQYGSDKIWSAIPYIPEVGKKPLVFYFEHDESNASILGDTVLFGFPFHMALLYNLSESNKIPIPMTDWKEVVSAVRDGQSFKPYGYPLKPIPINQVYAFKLEGKTQIINTTNEIRQKLAKEQ